jgi:hypothetical protein
VLIAVNDRSWLGDDSVNGVLANVLGLACVGVTVVVGLNGLGRVAGRLLDSEQPSPAVLVRLSGLIVLGIVALLLRVRRGSGSVTDMDR